MPGTRRNSIFIWCFLALGLSIQLIAYLWMPNNIWSLISGLLGICSVILASQGNILTFIFGFAQIGTYTYICWLEHLYGNIAINVFYFLSQIYGIYIWRHRGAGIQGSLHTRSLSGKLLTLIVLLIVAVSLFTGYLLSLYTNDSHPYMDAFTTIPAIMAQILMVLAYKEQWILWLIIDIIYVILWAIVANYCMLMQYVFWCINCIYGYIIWSRQVKQTATP